MSNATATAAQIRAALKAAGIKAKCRVTPGASDSVQVNVPTFEARFTDAEQGVIRRIAVDLGLTFVRSLPIPVDQPTMGLGDTYYLP